MLPIPQVEVEPAELLPDRKAQKLAECALRVLRCQFDGFIGPLAPAPSEDHDIGAWALAKLAEAVHDFSNG